MLGSTPFRCQMSNALRPSKEIGVESLEKHSSFLHRRNAAKTHIE